MIALRPLALLVLAVRPGALPADDEALYDLLRDAQATNVAATRSGRLHATLVLEYKPKKLRAEVEVFLDWDGDDDFVKYHYKTTDHWLFPHVTMGPDDPPEADGVTTYFARSADKVFGYEPVTKTVFVNSEQPRRLAVFEVIPSRAWYSCCPHSFTLSWKDMIGPNPARPNFRDCKFEIAREGEDRIVQTRRDPAPVHSVVTMVFSMEHGGNLVESHATGPTPGLSSTATTYRWRKVKGVSVLDEFDWTRSAPGKPETVEESYHLKVIDVDLSHKPDPSRFTLAALLKELPKDIRVVDNTAARPAGGGPIVSEGSLGDLGRVLLQRGFLKRK